MKYASTEFIFFWRLSRKWIIQKTFGIHVATWSKFAVQGIRRSVMQPATQALSTAFLEIINKFVLFE